MAHVVGDALREFPFLNSTWTEEGIRLKRSINMGIAVAIPDGLIVPVVRHADRLGFTDLARAFHDLAERARSKQLKPDDVAGGTFTLHNTGATRSLRRPPNSQPPPAALPTPPPNLRPPPGARQRS